MIRLYDLNSGFLFFLAGVFGSATTDLVLKVQLQSASTTTDCVLIIVSVLWGLGAVLWAISGMHLNKAHREVTLQFKPVFDESERMDIYQDVFSSRRRDIILSALGALVLSVGGEIVLIAPWEFC